MTPIPADREPVSGALMRVLHIGKFFPPFAGGMEHFLADLLPALAQQGAQVAALVHRHRPAEYPAPGEPAADSAIQVYRAPCYGRLLYAPISPAFPLWLARLIRAFQPHILHLHVPNTSAFWALAIPAARRLPWVIQWHSDVVASTIDRRLAAAYRLYRPLEQRLLAAGRGIVVSSPPYLAASEALSRWRAKCRIIPLGVDPGRLSDPAPAEIEAAEQHWDNAPFKVLAVGRLTYYKGHEVLIRAAAEVAGLRLIIVGAGEQRARLQALIHALGLSRRVELAGLRTDAQLHALFATCDALCLPSLERTEAFGVVLLEAMGFGKPVVASDIPGSGVGWVVRQGSHGLLVSPGDPAALAQALQQLARSPEQRLALGGRGALALRRTFHISQVARQMMALYRSVAPAPPGPEIKSADKTAAPASGAGTDG